MAETTKFRSLAEHLGIDIPSSVTARDDAPFEDPAFEDDPPNVRDFARGVLHSRSYRASLWRRIVTDELPPAVECKLLEYAYGKPIERVQVEDTTPRFEAVSFEELEQRALFYAKLLRQAREAQRDASRDEYPNAHHDPVH
jgi:hypothetical protein